MRTDEQREGKYDAKYVPATVSLKIASVLPGMRSGFSTAVQDLVAIEFQIQTVLNAAVVPTIQYPFYLNFGREIWKMQNKGIDGPSLASMAQSLHDKYVAYGLATANLVDIADQVFHITVT
jgi:hypothetical protein